MVGRGEIGDRAVFVVGGEAGQAADFAKAPLIEQQVDPLAAGELAAGALANDTRVGGIWREAATGDVLQGFDLGQQGGPGGLARPAPGNWRIARLGRSMRISRIEATGTAAPIRVTHPAQGAVISVSIFIVLMIISVPPTSTCAPALAVISTIAPARGLSTPRSPPATASDAGACAPVIAPA